MRGLRVRPVLAAVSGLAACTLAAAVWADGRHAQEPTRPADATLQLAALPASSAWTDEAPVPIPLLSARVLSEMDAPSTASALSAHFARASYDLTRVRAAGAQVPRVYLEALPQDLEAVPTVEAKKSLFIRTVLPLVLRVNEELAADRARLERLHAHMLAAGRLSAAERKWLAATAERYALESVDWVELFRRLDTVPPSLALAQAAVESGWGTSRFALEGNALFGQITYKPALGMLPERSEAGERRRVRSFQTLLAAVRSYIHNLNVHYAYDEFRRLRERLHRAGAPAGGEALVAGLGRYSERGADYIRTIRQIVRQNRLDDFDRVRLRSVPRTASAPGGGQPGATNWMPNQRQRPPSA